MPKGVFPEYTDRMLQMVSWWSRRATNVGKPVWYLQSERAELISEGLGGTAWYVLLQLRQSQTGPGAIRIA